MTLCQRAPGSGSFALGARCAAVSSPSPEGRCLSPSRRRHRALCSRRSLAARRAAGAARRRRSVVALSRHGRPALRCRPRIRMHHRTCALLNSQWYTAALRRQPFETLVHRVVMRYARLPRPRTRRDRHPYSLRLRLRWQIARPHLAFLRRTHQRQRWPSSRHSRRSCRLRPPCRCSRRSPGQTTRRGWLFPIVHRRQPQRHHRFRPMCRTSNQRRQHRVAQSIRFSTQTRDSAPGAWRALSSPIWWRIIRSAERMGCGTARYASCFVRRSRRATKSTSSRSGARWPSQRRIFRKPSMSCLVVGASCSEIHRAAGGAPTPSLVSDHRAPRPPASGGWRRASVSRS